MMPYNIIKREAWNILDKNTLTTLVTAAIIVIAMLLPSLDNSIRLIILFAGIALIIYTRRGTLYYGAANRKLMKKDPSLVPAAIEEYKKALKAGVPASATVTIGSILIHNGVVREGKDALERVLKEGTAFSEKEMGVQCDARTSLSMAYWIEGDNKKAIELCVAAYEMGCRTTNLYVNLSTYYLAERDVRSFLKLEKEFRANEKLKSPALRDLQAVALMLKGEWKSAEKLLDEMLTDHSYTFTDPYIHMAQVKLHFGSPAAALRWVEQALEVCTFLKVAVIKQECVEELEKLLESEESARELMADNEADPLALINGHLPKRTGKTFTFLPQEEAEEEIEDKEDEGSYEEEDVSTDLTAADEEWARRHGY